MCLKKSGMTVDLASIKGGEIPVDPMTLFWFIRSDYDNRYLSDEVFQQQAKKFLTASMILILRNMISSISQEVGALLMTWDIPTALGKKNE